MRSGYRSLDEAGLAPVRGEVHLRTAHIEHQRYLSADLLNTAAALAEEGPVLVSYVDPFTFAPWQVQQYGDALRNVTFANRNHEHSDATDAVRKLHLDRRSGDKTDDLRILAAQLYALAADFQQPRAAVPAAVLIADPQTLCRYTLPRFLSAVAAGDLGLVATALDLAPRGSVGALTRALEDNGRQKTAVVAWASDYDSPVKPTPIQRLRDGLQANVELKIGKGLGSELAFVANSVPAGYAGPREFALKGDRGTRTVPAALADASLA